MTAVCQGLLRATILNAKKTLGTRLSLKDRLHAGRMDHEGKMANCLFMYLSAKELVLWIVI